MKPVRSWIGLGFSGLMLFLCTTLPVGVQAADSARISFFHPAQLTRGETTRVTVDGNFDAIQAVEIAPPEGVSVQKIERDGEYQGQKRWQIEFLVAKDANPGERSVILVTSKGRSQPQKVVLPPHAPVLSDFKALTVERNPIKVVFSITVFDAEDDLDSPSFLKSLKCGGSIAISIGHASDMKKVAPGTYTLQATFSDEKAVASPGMCQLSLKLADKNEYEGRLTVPIEFK